MKTSPPWVTLVPPRTLTIAVATAAIGFFLEARAGVAAQFGAPTNFPTGGHAGSIVVADFNHDAKPDIAVAHYGVSVLLGLGNGGFAAPASYSDSASGSVTGTGLAAGDFNNDGNLDLVTSTGSVLLGDGRGGFPARTNFASFFYQAGLAAGDFNGDGNLDLAIAEEGLFLRILSGRGDGSFSTSTDYLLPSSSMRDIRVGDTYANGGLDVAVSLERTGSNSFCILSNKGDGTFAAPNYYADTRVDSHGSLELGDFNADGKPDIAVLNTDSYSLTIWTNRGHGNFVRAREYALGFSPWSIAKGDLNGDGKIDLVVYGGTTAKLLLGTGDGSFTVFPAVSVPSGAYGTAVAVGSFDGNGTPDLVFVDSSGSSVAVMLNQTPPTLQLAPLAGYNQISWLAAFGTDYTLEYATNLVTASWQPFPYPPVLIGSQKAVTDWADRERRFYRLRKR